MINKIFFAVISIIFTFSSLSAQVENDSLKNITDYKFESTTYLDYKLREFIIPVNFNSSLNLMILENKEIGTESLSDLNYALNQQYNFKYNSNKGNQIFQSVLAGVGAAAAVSLGVIHLKKYGSEYFKREKK
ncbi:MAG: hypothetical protein CMF23_12720 [Ignavibacteriae bacterium]|nr:hypothetical protein [Ignavibacteriota bacterium]|tara:strand:- start:331 stop:726 length:396 start_codon:yes stop_codon:yes gene_type:complete